MTNKLAVVFPGQGSQMVGMLTDIAQAYPEVEKTFAIASDVVGYDLWKLSSQGPTEELDKTVHTQPALLAASYAIWQIISAKKQWRPAWLAGHSLGEYTALVCADAISFKDGIALVAARGKFMQEAVTHCDSGLAAIIGLEDIDVKKICLDASDGEVLAAANFNSPGQVVIAGHLTAVERALVLAKASGARLAKLLSVSVASHCVLMAPAAEKLASLLKDIAIQSPKIPVVNNVDVKIYENADMIRDGLTRQLCHPVRWVETIRLLSSQGVNQIVECGPGKVLSGLIKRIDSNIQLTTTADLASLQTLLETSFATN